MIKDCHVGYIIGREGATIRELEKKFDVAITIGYAFVDRKFKVGNIVGPAKKVRLAIGHITGLISCLPEDKPRRRKESPRENQIDNHQAAPPQDSMQNPQAPMLELAVCTKQDEEDVKAKAVDRNEFPALQTVLSYESSSHPVKQAEVLREQVTQKTQTRRIKDQTRLVTGKTWSPYETLINT